jgi:hypothetical protein
VMRRREKRAIYADGPDDEHHADPLLANGRTDMLKIMDLTRNEELSTAEMGKVAGGVSWLNNIVQIADQTMYGTSTKSDYECGHGAGGPPICIDPSAPR